MPWNWMLSMPLLRSNAHLANVSLRCPAPPSLARSTKGSSRTTPARSTSCGWWLPTRSRTSGAWKLSVMSSTPRVRSQLRTSPCLPTARLALFLRVPLPISWEDDLLGGPPSPPPFGPLDSPRSAFCWNVPRPSRVPGDGHTPQRFVVHEHRRSSNSVFLS